MTVKVRIVSSLLHFSIILSKASNTGNILNCFFRLVAISPLLLHECVKFGCFPSKSTTCMCVLFSFNK